MDFNVLSLEESTKESEVFKGNFFHRCAVPKPLTYFRFMLVPSTRDAIPAQNAAIAAEDFHSQADMLWTSIAVALLQAFLKGNNN